MSLTGWFEQLLGASVRFRHQLSETEISDMANERSVAMLIRVTWFPPERKERPCPSRAAAVRCSGKLITAKEEPGNSIRPINTGVGAHDGIPCSYTDQVRASKRGF